MKDLNKACVVAHGAQKILEKDFSLLLSWSYSPLKLIISQQICGTQYLAQREKEIMGRGDPALSSKSSLAKMPATEAPA